MHKIHMSRRIVCALPLGMAVVCLAMLVPTANAMPRAPYPPFPEVSPLLFQERFDEVYSFSATNVQVSAGNSTLVQGWSGYALDRSGSSLVPFVVDGVDSGGHTNLNCYKCAARFYFTPYWSSVSVADGTGPGASATLLDLEALGSSGQTVGVWSLKISSDGSAISLLAQSDSGPVTLLAATGLGWQAGSAHCIALNFGTNGTQLFIDGQLSAEGAGTVALPSSLAELAIGTTLAGAEIAGGAFDEVYLFSGTRRTANALSESDVAFYYNATKDAAAVPPTSPEADAAAQEARAERVAAWQLSASFSIRTLDSLDTPSECITGGQVYLTNTAAWFDTNQGSQISFEVRGGSPNVLYEVWTATNLLSGGWFWTTNTYTCSTVYLVQQPPAQAFYRLADSSLLSSDGYGTPNEWYWLHGLNPRTPGIGSQDPNGNGVPNWQEYLRGGDPLALEAFAIWIGAPAGLSNLP